MLGCSCFVPALQLDGPIGVLGLLLFRVFEFCVFLFTIIYGVRLAGPEHRMHAPRPAAGGQAGLRAACRQTAPHPQPPPIQTHLTPRQQCLQRQPALFIVRDTHSSSGTPAMR